jgi:hypothetical protein
MNRVCAPSEFRHDAYPERVTVNMPGTSTFRSDPRHSEERFLLRQKVVQLVPRELFHERGIVRTDEIGCELCLS